MPRTKTGPDRTNRLTALVSDKEMNRAKRLVKGIDGISNLSDLLRQLVDDKYAEIFPRKQRVSKAKAEPKAEAKAAPKKRGRKPKAQPIEVADAKPKVKRRRRKSANGVTVQAAV